VAGASGAEIGLELSRSAVVTRFVQESVLISADAAASPNSSKAIFVVVAN
jgi:hypothetical protein